MDAISQAPVDGTLLRIVLTGSESSGKTTLAALLAEHYGVLMVPEFVREYAAGKDTPLDFSDHGPIARGQMALEDAVRQRAVARGDALLIGDTDLVSTVVYCHHYFGRCPLFIEEAAIARRADHYLLMDIDVPWVADGVRDREHLRPELHALFRSTLERLELAFTEVRGDWDSRFAHATGIIDALLAQRGCVDS
jgi:NadR type nicotinamide-nucleotide adenylyltransferase